MIFFKTIGPVYNQKTRCSVAFHLESKLIPFLTKSDVMQEFSSKMDLDNSLIFLARIRVLIYPKH